MTKGMLPAVLEDYRGQIEAVKAGGLALAEQMTPQQRLERLTVEQCLERGAEKHQGAM